MHTYYVCVPLCRCMCMPMCLASPCHVCLCVSLCGQCVCLHMRVDTVPQALGHCLEDTISHALFL